MKLFVGVCILVVFCGCVHLGSRSHYRQFSLANHSNVEIYSVVVDSGDARNHFGFLNHGKGHATAAGCKFTFSPDFAIEWEEKDVVRRALVDIQQYGSKKDDIYSFWFYYSGKDKWKVVARTGIAEGSKVIEP